MQQVCVYVTQFHFKMVTDGCLCICFSLNCAGSTAVNISPARGWLTAGASYNRTLNQGWASWAVSKPDFLFYR